MRVKEQLKEYFTFTKGESQGIVILLIILLFIVIINIFSPYFFTEKKYDFSKYEKLLTEINSDTSKFAQNQNLLNSDSFKLFKFNPNNISLAEALQLGLSEYQYNMIRKYLNSGGHFDSKNDFSKIYSIKSEQFEYLKPFIDLPEKENKTKIDKTENFSVSETNPDVSYFLFDPNTLDDAGWQRLGFSEKQIISIRKYINAGGKFYKKEDLKKLYVIDEKKYAELEPYINFQEKENTLKNNVPEKHQKIDINNLSADELKKYGKFWQYNATRIIKYRNLLGGYYKKEQLLEVYGVKKEYYDKIAGDITIDKSKLEKINVNFAEVSELGRHPYISWEIAKQIIEYRNNNGAYKNIEDIKIRNNISDKIFKTIAPYIKVK